MTEEFNPSDYTADEVVDHLENADAAEKAKVLQAEEAGKGRKTVLESDAAEALQPAQFEEEQLHREEPDGRVKYPWEV